VNGVEITHTIPEDYEDKRIIESSKLFCFPGWEVNEEQS
jgi:hypothetical protein